MKSKRRPPCVLFTVNAVCQMDLDAMKKLIAAVCEIVVVQESHFEEALNAIESARCVKVAPLVHKCKPPKTIRFEV